MSKNESIMVTEGKMRSSWPVLQKAADFSERFAQCRDNNLSTPDIPELYQERGHLIFVYGSLKSHFPRHYLLETQKARFVAVGITWQKYSLFYDAHRKDERFPVLLGPRKGSDSGHVVGQVWLVHPRTIVLLDRMERNGELYHRLPMNIQLTSKPKDKNFQEYSCLYCHSYMGVPSVWNPMIDSDQMTYVPLTNLYTNEKEKRFINWSKKQSHIWG